MVNHGELQLKIMVYDSNPIVIEQLSKLSGSGKLSRFQSVQFDLIDFLANPYVLNTEVGAIFLTDEEDENGLTGFHVAEKIGTHRIALPLFLRVTKPETLERVESDCRHLFAGTYTADDLSTLEAY